MEGGTTFFFVTGGFDAALEQARAAAGDLDVDIAGGAATVRQAFAAKALDEIVLDIIPVLLGSAERLLEGVDDLELEPAWMDGCCSSSIGRPRATFHEPDRPAST